MQKKAQEVYSMLCDIESAWQNINDCLEQYKKITKRTIRYGTQFV